MSTNSRLKQFFNYIKKREEIRIKKESGALWPWAEDKILQTYKFCNVRRKDDKCSVYLMDTLARHPELRFRDKVLNIILFRRFNVMNLFGILGRVYNCDESIFWLEQALDQAREKGFKLFNDAYAICQVPYNALQRKTEKHAQIAYSMVDIALREDLDAPLRLGEAKLIFDWLHFGGKHRIGDFLAYQILLDISYIMPAMKRIKDFVYVGPGALGGLDLIHGHHKESEKQCKLIWQASEHTLPFNPRLSLADIQHNLCEFRKFCNLSTEPEKHRKRYYKPV